jgi:DNA polymerase III sliding clamp (beta) subunit (PCNA family)
VTDLVDLAESEPEDVEYIPTILPVDARLAVRGPVSVFLPLLDRAAAVIPAKEALSGTSHALLEAFGPQPGTLPYVRLSATDGAQSVSLVADGVDVIMSGAVLVPAKKIADVLRLAPSSQAYIEVLGNSIVVRSGRAQWTVQTLVGDRLPPFAETTGMTLHTGECTPLLYALSSAKKAASTTNARAALMQISIKDGAVTGIDGGRLHRIKIPDLPLGLSLTLPLKAADEVMRMLRSALSNEAQIGGNASHVVVSVDQDVLIAQRTLVPFPDIEREVLSPSLNNIHTMTVDRDSLLNAIKRVRISADPDFQSVILTLTPGTAIEGVWSLTVSARDRSGNAAQESVEIMWAGPDKARSLVVNHHYLTDLLSVIPQDSVAFKIGDDTKAERHPLFVEDQGGVTGYVHQMRPGFSS